MFIPIYSKVKGLFFGQAIGDSIGLCTEFMIKEEVKQKYGANKQLFRNIDKISDYHRNTWVTGDWTDDTDIFLCLVKSLVSAKKYDSQAFAKNLLDWLSHGLPECGDKCGHGAGNTTSIWWGDEFNVTDPERTGVRTLIYDPFRPFNSASNGSLMRISVLGTLNLPTSEIIEVVQNHSMTTHASPQCFLACVYYVLLIAKVMKLGEPGTSLNPAVLDQWLNDLNTTSILALSNYCKVLEEKMLQEVNVAIGNLSNPEPNMSSTIVQSYQNFTPYNIEGIMNEFHQYLGHQNLQELSLDTQIGYVFKTLACAVITFKKFVHDVHHNSLQLSDSSNIGKLFHEALSNIALEAGDADTNGCVAGALLGAYIGHDNIPTQLVNDLIYKALLEEHFEKYISTGLVLL
jgi:ADP-ribosylglycohydrolase